MCEFVGNIADDPMTNIQSSTGCNDTIIRESLSGPTISVISNVDNVRLDRVVEDSLDEEGEYMVAYDAKKGMLPMRQAKTEEQKHIENMKVFEVVHGKEVSGSKVIRTGWIVTNRGTPE